jgi:hypothetical protein
MVAKSHAGGGSLEHEKKSRFANGRAGKAAQGKIDAIALFA